MQHHTLETIYTLLSASTTPKQNIRVEIKKLLPLIAQLDPINYLDYYQEIILLIQQIEQKTQQKQITEKTPDNFIQVERINIVINHNNVLGVKE